MVAISDYFQFLKNNFKLLLFGILLTIFSGFGQTFFISLFNPNIRNLFKLSHGDFGLIYSSATLVSGFVIIWLGKKIDHTDLKKYSISVCLLMFIASILLYLANSIIILFLAIFGLRLSCQGLMSHTSKTSMARYFDNERGKALSFVSIGHPLGEAILPITFISLSGFIGWKYTWLSISFLPILILIPLIVFLLKENKSITAYEMVEKSTRKSSDTLLSNWSNKDLFKDLYFWLIIPAALAPPFIYTGIFFHQVHLIQIKGWDINLFATSFMTFAIGAILASIFAGFFVDKFKGKNLIPFALLPLCIAVLVLSLFNHIAVPFIFMIISGLSIGFFNVSLGALWAEVYGVVNLGAIRSMVSSIRIFSTAISPVLFGKLIDLDVSINSILFACFLYLLISNLLSFISLRINQKKEII